MNTSKTPFTLTMRNGINYLGCFIILLSIFITGCEDDTTVNDVFTAVLKIEATEITVTEGIDNNASIVFSLDKVNTSGSSISIKYAVSGTALDGEDFQSISGTALVADGSNSISLDISLIDDEVFEQNETIIITLDTSNLPDGVTFSGSNKSTITIQDNDEAAGFTALVSITASDGTSLEGDNDGEFVISLDQSNTSGATISIAYTISGTATEGADYSAVSGSVDILEGSSSTIVAISVIDDAVVETNETVIVTLDSSQPQGISLGTNTMATVNITDNDNTSETVTFTIGETTSNSITIDSWTTISGVDGYIIIISDTDNFTDLVDGDDPAASTTYVGYDEQVVYSGSGSSSVTITMLSYDKTYYFKAFPYTGTTYDNAQTSESATSISCSTSSTTVSQVCFEMTTDTRIISSNQYPSHAVGNFPNADPTAIQVTRNLDRSPATTGSKTYLYDETGPPTPSNQNFYQFGIANNGVEFHPMGLKPWTNPSSGEENWEWQAKVTEQGETDLDAYGAHVTSAGNYHYHGDISGLAVDEDGNRHSLLYGFSGDGFPIYYKYGYTDANDPTSGVKELLSSYQLKSGSRTGTGTAGQEYPSGTYDGSYIQDFEYVNGLGDLDECNGRTGVTPEFPEGTYYYIITTDFPVTPNCFSGTPSSEWIIGK